MPRRLGDRLGDRVRGLEALGAGVAVGAAGVEERPRATVPSLTTSWLHRTGLALQRLAVKTLAESKVGPVVDDERDVLGAGGLQAGGDAGGPEALRGW